MGCERLLLPLLSTILVIGCATPPQIPSRLYLGEPRSEGQVAKVWFDEAKQTQPMFGYWEWVQLRAVDGEVVKEDTNSKREYLILPGIHRLTVRYVYDPSGAQGLIEALVGQAIQESMTKRFESDITLDAKKGAEYAVRFVVNKESALTPAWNWNVIYRIVDAKTGDVIFGGKP
jgi:hypothetical protein